MKTHNKLFIALALFSTLAFNSHAQELSDVPADAECVWEEKNKQSGPRRVNIIVAAAIAAYDMVTKFYTNCWRFGSRHGQWALRFDDGSVDVGPMVGGERYGHWTGRSADGTVSAGPMVGNEKHGDWTVRFANGDLQKSTYVKGKEHGQFTLLTHDGWVLDGQMVNDEKHGQWTLTDPDGKKLPAVNYVNGKF